MPSIKDNIVPKESWEFDDTVTRVFDDMLARSIPQYEVMRQAVTDIAKPYVKQDSWIVDLGCSRGQALKPFVDCFGENNRYLGIEVSESMALAARKAFHGNEQVVIRQDDLRIRFPQERASVILSVLTLQFIPIEYRQQIIQQVYDNLLPNGAFIIVEKVLGNTAKINNQMVNIYYALKGDNGYSPEQIERKRLSLEGILVPVTAKWNEELLYQSGFKQADCFWRWMNFAGWIAIK